MCIYLLAQYSAHGCKLNKIVSTSVASCGARCIQGHKATLEGPKVSRSKGYTQAPRPQGPKAPRSQVQLPCRIVASSWCASHLVCIAHLFSLVCIAILYLFSQWLPAQATLPNCECLYVLAQSRQGYTSCWQFASHLAHPFPCHPWRPWLGTPEPWSTST